MKDLKETLEKFSLKALEVIKSVDKVINGEEKNLVLEVGSHTTKIVEYVVKKQTIEITGGAVLNTPVNSIENDRLVDINTLANVIEQTLKTEKIRTKEFIVSIVSKEIITREMTVPNMKERDLKNFVQLNSNDIFPVKLSNYVLGYNMIEKGATNRVMIAAIPKEIVLPYIELADKLGLYLKGVNYSGYELYNFLDFEIDSPMETYLALDLGARNTNIVIIANGILKFNKIVPKGSQSTSMYISEELNCSLTKAEQLKRQYNTIEDVTDMDSNSDANIVAKYTRRCIDNIMQDVSRIMEFYNSNNVKNKISKIYIIGTAGKILGIEEYIEKKLNIKAKAVKNLNKVVFNKSAIKLKARQYNFINCLGAHELKSRKFYVIKKDLKLKKLALLLKPKFHKMAFCVILIMIAFLVSEYNSLKRITNSLDYYNDYVSSNTNVISLKNKVSSKSSELEAAKNSISKITVGFEDDLGILEVIENGIVRLNTDANVYVTRYKFQRNIIEIRGRIEPPIGIDQASAEYYLYKNLPFNLVEVVENNTNKEVTVTSNTVSGTANIEFTLKITV